MVFEKILGSKKKITTEQLNERLDTTQKSMSEFAVATTEKFSQINQTLSTISDDIRSIREAKNIPNDMMNIIVRMKEINPTLPSAEIIYKVLMSYKNLSSDTAKIQQEKVKEKLVNIKKEIVEKKFHNCDECGKNISEGEYYKVGNQYFCLEHREKDGLLWTPLISQNRCPPATVF